MERLAGAQELLDGPLDDPATLAGNLRDLRRANALLGGVRLSLYCRNRFTAFNFAASLRRHPSVITACRRAPPPRVRREHPGAAPPDRSTRP